MNQHDDIILKTSISGRRQPGVIVARICPSDIFNVSIYGKQSSFIVFPLFSSILLSKWKFVRNIRKSIKMVLAIPMFGYDLRNRDVFISRDFHHWLGEPTTTTQERMAPANFVFHTITKAMDTAFFSSDRLTESTIHPHFQGVISLIREVFRTISVPIKRHTCGSQASQDSASITQNERSSLFYKKRPAPRDFKTETFDSSILSNIIRFVNLKKLVRLDRSSSDRIHLLQLDRSSHSSTQSFLSRLIHHTESVPKPDVSAATTFHSREQGQPLAIATAIIRRFQFFANTVSALRLSLATDYLQKDYFISTLAIHRKTTSAHLQTGSSFSAGGIYDRTSLTYGPDTTVTVGGHFPITRTNTGFLAVPYSTDLQSSHSIMGMPVKPDLTVHGIASTDQSSGISQPPLVTPMQYSRMIEPVRPLHHPKPEMHGRTGIPATRTTLSPVSTAFRNLLTTSNQTGEFTRLMHGKSISEFVSDSEENTHAYHFDHFSAQRPDLHYTRLPQEFDGNDRAIAMTQPSETADPNIAAKSNALRKPKGIANFPSDENIGSYRISQLAEKVSVIFEEKYRTEAKRKGLL